MTLGPVWLLGSKQNWTTKLKGPDTTGVIGTFAATIGTSHMYRTKHEIYTMGVLYYLSIGTI